MCGRFFNVNTGNAITLFMQGVEGDAGDARETVKINCFASYPTLYIFP